MTSIDWSSDTEFKCALNTLPGLYTHPALLDLPALLCVELARTGAVRTAKKETSMLSLIWRGLTLWTCITCAALRERSNTRPDEVCNLWGSEIKSTETTAPEKRPAIISIDVQWISVGTIKPFGSTPDKRLRTCFGRSDHSTPHVVGPIQFL